MIVVLSCPILTNSLSYDISLFIVNQKGTTMTKKTIKLELSENQYRELETIAKAKGKSVSAYLRGVVHHTGRGNIGGDGVLFDADRIERESYNVKEGEDYQTSGARKNAEIDYTILGDRLYPLWLQLNHGGAKGARLPSLGVTEAFYQSVEYADRSYYRDITKDMTEFETNWLLAWAYSFDHIEPLWWDRCNIWQSEARYPAVEDYEIILKLFLDNVKAEELRREEADTPFSVKYPDQLKELGLIDDDGKYLFKKKEEQW